jgi:hypothetical protein
MATRAIIFIWKTLALTSVMFTLTSTVLAAECTLSTPSSADLVVATLEKQTHTCYTESVSENNFRLLYPLKGYVPKTFQITEPSAERCPDIQSEAAYMPNETCSTYAFKQGGIYIMTLSKTNDVYSIACCNGFVEPLAFAFEPKVIPLAIQIYLQPVLIDGYNFIQSVIGHFSPQAKNQAE